MITIAADKRKRKEETSSKAVLLALGFAPALKPVAYCLLPIAILQKSQILASAEAKRRG